jgi:hypothetical protein
VHEDVEGSMEGIDRLHTLRADGRLRWSGRERAWVGQPDEIVAALANAGFTEYRREVARTRHGGSSGGVWQGLHPRTGQVASAIWVAPAGDAAPRVFIDIDGESVAGEAA